MSEGAEIIEQAQVARGLSATITIKCIGGAWIMRTEWTPAEPVRVRGVALERWQRARDRAIQRAEELAGGPVDVVVR